MGKVKLAAALLWMIAIFLAYYWLKTSEIIAFYLGG